uniref:Uncharacterized protein n=1 Tax=Arundo donax TaxID=35708 RepID=A0A0A9AP72_ARUDO
MIYQTSCRFDPRMNSKD